MGDEVSRQVGSADHVSVVAEAAWITNRAPQRAEIRHLAVLPKKRSDCRDPGCRIGSRISVRVPGNLSPLVDKDSGSVVSAQRA